MSEFWMKVGKTLDWHARRALRAARGLWWDLRPRPADRPIIVVGCSRAGTTLVYKTLSESREIGSLQRETHDFWSALHPPAAKDWATHALDAADASPADRDYVSRYFYAWTGHHRWVDKNNQNGLCVPYLDALFPDAHFVFVKRSPGDNINSLIEGWKRPDEFATWSGNLPARVAIDQGRFDRWCFFLAEGWRDYLESSIEAVCAFQYRSMNEAILAGRDLIDAERWHEVFYEDLVRDPVAGFRGMFEACGLSFTPELETHSAGVLQRPYNAFSEIRLDKWRGSPNRERIEAVLPEVLETAKRLGYDL